MAICVTTSGASLITSSTPIGSCTDYVLQTASEYAVTVPPISIDDSVFLAWAVVSVWAVAWAVKVLRRTL